MESLPADADRPSRGSPPAPEIEGEAVLAALDDPDCRTILAAVDDGPRCAQAIAEACDLPRSTTYRKIDRLAAAGLLAERTCVATDRNNWSEYRTAVAAVRVARDGADGLTVTLVYRDDRPPATVPLSE